MNPAELSPEQRLVVDTVARGDGRLVVLGGPGTGKTTTALWAARSYLERHNEAARRRVLFLTFSRSGVGQIAARSPEAIGPYGDQIEIMTFHALAYRLIRAFGRYAGHGIAEPSIQTRAWEKLFGRESGALSYDDLVPTATEMLNQSKRMRSLIQNRWGVVICDEAQDTDPGEWDLLQAISRGDLVLLGDPHQMIYTFRDGVSPAHFDAMQGKVGRTIDLGRISFRDPSGSIPALADAVRRRDFGGQAVTDAVKTERLRIHTDVSGESVADVVSGIVRNAIQQGNRDVNIFIHTNAAVASFADELRAVGLDFDIAGLPEAHAVALECLNRLCRYGIGLATDEDVRQGLALFLTALSRDKQAPVLAQALIGSEDLNPLIDSAIRSAESRLRAQAGGEMRGLVQRATQTWDDLGITSGLRAWAQAAEHFERIATPLFGRRSSETTMTTLNVAVEQHVERALVNVDYTDRGRVKLMTYHQAKGREADVVVHVFQADDYFGRDREPYQKMSRVLNVAISRARKRVEVVLPRSPHPVVAPFVRTAPRRGF